MARTGRALRLLFGAEGTVATEPVMGVVMGSTAMAVAGVFVVSPIVAPLAGAFAVSDGAAGQLVTAFTAPSILLVPVAGVLADRLGRKPVLVGGLVVFGLGGSAVALAPSFAVALALRAVQGIGYAAVIPVGVTLLGDLYTADRESTAQGLRVASIQTTNLVSPPIAGALVLASWRYPFLLYLLAFPVAWWAWSALPTVDPSGAASLRGYGRDLVSTLARPTMALVMGTFVVRFLLLFAFFAFVSVLLADRGATAVASGLVVSGFGLASLSAATQTGRLTGAYDPAVVLTVGFIGGGAGMSLMGLAGLSQLLVGLVLLAVGAGVTGPVQKSLVTRLAPPSERAGAVSSAVVFQSVGQAAGPVVIGVGLGVVDISAAFIGVGVGCGVVGALLGAGAYALG